LDFTYTLSTYKGIPLECQPRVNNLKGSTTSTIQLAESK